MINDQLKPFRIILTKVGKSQLYIVRVKYFLQSLCFFWDGPADSRVNTHVSVDKSDSVHTLL